MTSLDVSSKLPSQGRVVANGLGTSAANGRPSTARMGAAPRVVLVLPTYLPESFGGAEQQSRKLGLALSRLGIDVTLLAPCVLPQTPTHGNDQTISLRRFRVQSPPSLGGRHMFSLLVWGAKLLWWLTRNRSNYDIIHIIHGRLHALPAVLAGTLLGKPTLIKIGRGGQQHFDIDLVSRKRVIGSWYSSVLVRYTTGYIANSREITQDLRRWQVASHRIHEIPNGVELPALVDDAWQGSAVRCVYLGRLDPEKSVDMMIRGFSRLPDQSAATLKIVGDGACRAELEALTSELGLRDRVIFTGAVADVTASLRAADVFISTSVSEGMSNALLESMSFGLMPLVSRVSGVTDIVEDNRSGLLFDPADLDEFVRRLETAVKMTAAARRAFGTAARATVRDRFGIDKVAEQHVALYRTLCS